MSTRQALSYVELDLNWCSRDYGITCPAQLGVDSPIKCFNTLATCPVRDSYDPRPVTLRFAMPAKYRPLDIEAIPSLVSVDYAPARLNPGEDLGTTASITFKFRTHPHSDTGPGHDKYHAERPWNPYEQGDYWAKFRARNPSLKGEPIRWITGFVGDDLADMETRHFFVESTNGPDEDGIFTIVATDPFSRIDGENANLPRPSSGNLNAPITAAATTAVLSPAGIGDAEYPSSGYINIGGKEVVSFTRNDDTLTIVRARQNTTATTHDAEERMQICLELSGSPAAISHTLLVDGAGFDDAWINLDDWEDEVTAYLRRDYYRFIAEPTSVNTLQSDLIRNAGLLIWWDDLALQIRFQVLRQIATDAALYDDSIIVEDSLTIEEQPELRVSRVWCRYAMTDPLKGAEEENNYRSFLERKDEESEREFGGQQAKKTMWAPWIPPGGASTAERACDLWLGRYSRPPRRIPFRLFRGELDAPQLGGGYQVEARPIQDATGALERVPVQLIEVKPDEFGWDVIGLEMRYRRQATDDVGNKTVTIDVSTSAVVGRTLHDNLFPDPVAGDEVTFIISESATVSAPNTATPAFDTGVWPTVVLDATGEIGSPLLTGLASTEDFAAGMAVTGLGIPNHSRIVSVGPTEITLDQNLLGTGTTEITVHTVIINIDVRGRLQGAGGRGGRGKTQNGASATSGLPGGTALKLRHPVNLIVDKGLARVWSGGGGGGGAGVLNLDQHKGGGGGGGAGIVAGGGGASDYAGGSSGSATAGGIGGNSYASWSAVAWPGPTGVRGGTGGAPGANGAAGGHHGGSNAGEPGNGGGGLAGPAIDGNSLAKRIGTGDVRGRLIN